MSTSAELVTYPVTVAAIAETKAKYAGLSCDTPAGYEEVRLAIAHVRTTRVAVEDRRVALKADALAYGRLVDSKAKEITAMLLEIEEPLKAKKAAVDDEKARIKAEAEAVKLRALEAEIAANRARQEEEARLVREAEEKRLAEERAAIEAERAKLAEAQAKLDAERKAEQDRIDTAARIERERIDAEREKLAAERRVEEDRQRVEREKIEAERRAVAAEREKAERAEFERQAKIRAEQEAIEKIERERVAAEKRAAELAALRPDLEKVAAFAAQVRALKPPDLEDEGLEEEMGPVLIELKQVTDALDGIVEARRG